MDFWTEVLKYALITFFGGFITFFFTRQVKTHDERTAERDQRFTDLIESMTEVSKMNAEQLLGKIALIDAMDKRMERQDEQIQLLKDARAERDKQIAEMQVRIQTDQMETESLRREIIQLREQIADGERRYMEIERRYIEVRDKYNKVVEFFVKYLRDKDETVPPDLALLLGDSISKFKAIKPEDSSKK